VASTSEVCEAQGVMPAIWSSTARVSWYRQFKGVEVKGRHWMA
jgi:hypothetical protein